MISQNTSTRHPLIDFQSPEEVLQYLSENRRTILGLFCGLMAVATFAILLLPKTYQSEAKLFVRVGRESITLDPTATTGQTISVYESREAEMNSVLEVLRSRAIIEKVVDRVGVSTLSPGSTDTPSVRETIIRDLEAAIGFDAAKKSSVVTVTAKSHSPQVAQQIVQTILDVFQQEHLRINRTAGSHEFFVELTRKSLGEVQGAQAALRDAKNEMGLTSIEGHRNMLQDQINAVESATMSAETELASTDAGIASMKSLIAATPERLVAQETNITNVATDNTRTALHTLQVRERELLTRYTAIHPAVVAVREQIEQVESQLVDLKPRDTQSTSTLNPAWQQLQLTLLAEESKSASLRARLATYRQQYAQLQNDLKLLNRHEVEIDNLSRAVELAQANYRIYVEKREQARIDEELEVKRISNVNVVQAASYIEKPVSPKRRIVFAVALIVAALTSLAYPVGRDYLQVILPNGFQPVPQLSRQLPRAQLVSETATMNS